MHSKIITTVIVFFTVTLVLLGMSGRAQHVLHDLGNKSTYEFLEELAAIQAIDLNSTSLPLSRKKIYDLLQEAKLNRDKLNKRQQKELDFHFQEFIKEKEGYRELDFIGKNLRSGGVFPLKNRLKRYDLFFYKDSLFTISVNSRFSGEGIFTSNSLDYERVVGLRLFGSVTKYFSFYADLRDFDHSTRLTDEEFLTQRMGANYKSNSGEFSEMRGGVMASTKWGALGFVKDHISWGNAYNGSNIFSGRTPSFPMIKLHLNPVKWFSFDYFHGWLVSDVLDSAATYPAGGSIDREIMRSKFIAANLFTVRPIKRLYFSFGNSIVYSDRFNPVFLIPFLFYKSVDHTLNSTGPGNSSRGQNSQMFVNLVSRQIPFTQLYTSVFVDEIQLSTMFNPRSWRNHLSWKVGLRFTTPNAINASLIFEYTRNNPFVYQHFINTTTFQSNSYDLGHYLGDNAEQYYVSLLYKPVPRALLKVCYEHSRIGEKYEYTNGSDGSGHPFLIREIMRRNRVSASASYEFAHDISLQLSYSYLKETGIIAYQRLPSFAPNVHSARLSVFIGI